MWFLIPYGSQWDVLQARAAYGITGLFVPAQSNPTSGVFGYSSGTSLPDVLTLEAAAGVEAAGEDPQLMLELLGISDTPAVQTVLAVFSGSADAAHRAVGLAGVILRGRSGALATLVQMWPGISSDPHRRHVVAAIRDVWRDSSPTAVEQLSSIAGSISSSELRAAAIRALASIHSRESLPFMSQLLASNDPAEQVLGSYGMASFANGCPMQTNATVASMAHLFCSQPSPYRNRETLANFFLPGAPSAQVVAAASFWQQWWNAHGELH